MSPLFFWSSKCSIIYYIYRIQGEGSKHTMSDLEELKQQRDEILTELAGLDEMRRGSVVEQFVESTRKDGSTVRRGPYFLYSYKEKGKTVSQRLKDAEEADLYRHQIQSFRRFQELTSQLRKLGEKISGLAVGQRGGKKTSRC